MQISEMFQVLTANDFLCLHFNVLPLDGKLPHVPIGFKFDFQILTQVFFVQMVLKRTFLFSWSTLVI